MKKILIVRFSSIGDIVLTTPVIRCCKQQLKNTEIHFVCKTAFKPLLQNNPYIDKLHSFNTDLEEVFSELLAEKFDLIVDLHRNLRSFRLKHKLKVKSYSFNKINLRKLAAVGLKRLDILPSEHIVDRYLETVSELGVKSDGKGLDYFLSDEDKTIPRNVDLNESFIALVLGGSYYTKKIPINKLQEICRNISIQIVLLGGKEDKSLAHELSEEFTNTINLCGELSLGQSAFVISRARWVITSDTGLMHIAAAFGKKIISVWGNTVPEFGMGPYLPNEENKILEMKRLTCRPCSKLGFHQCPKKHFKCMNDIDYSFLKELEIK